MGPPCLGASVAFAFPLPAITRDSAISPSSFVSSVVKRGCFFWLVASSYKLAASYVFYYLFALLSSKNCSVSMGRAALRAAKSNTQMKFLLTPTDHLLIKRNGLQGKEILVSSGPVPTHGISRTLFRQGPIFQPSRTRHQDLCEWHCSLEISALIVQDDQLPFQNVPF